MISQKKYFSVARNRRTYCLQILQRRGMPYLLIWIKIWFSERSNTRAAFGRYDYGFAQNDHSQIKTGRKVITRKRLFSSEWPKI